MEQSKYLATGIAAVKAAETEIISQFKKTNKQVTQKADGSPVTIADKNAEEIIRQVLTNHFPEHGFIGEEYGKNQEKTGKKREKTVKKSDRAKSSVAFSSTEIASMSLHSSAGARLSSSRTWAVTDSSSCCHAFRTPGVS